MLMELAYRIAVDNTPFIRTIRENSIVLITPILEVDGRDKYVDIAMLPRKDPKASFAARLVYWGKYVAHDNNRDNIGQALALSKHIMAVALDYHPQVMHDLHESASHLYISTGSGPYNAWLDPIVIDEWHQMAYHEVSGMTREGVPGVWTHQFYDGWAPNYAFYAANGHNAIGRFYETQGAGDGSNRVITNSTDRAWFRPNPPVAQTVWSIRNNVNLQQSALLMGMNYVAANKQRFLENFYLKSRRSVAKAKNEGPAAYVFPASDPRPWQAARLLRLLQAQGVEIHKAGAAFKVKDVEYPAGSHIVRMDQPYSRMADMVLDTQHYNVNDPRPYDDVGWTLGPLFNVVTVRTDDLSVLAVPMTLVRGEVRSAGGVVKLGRGPAAAYLINHNADNVLAAFLFKTKSIPRWNGIKIRVAEKAFEAEGRKFNAGSVVIKAADADQSDYLEGFFNGLGEAGGEILAYAVPAAPDVPAHDLVVPRVAVMHTWQNTQTEGWVRIALDDLQIPYDYISVLDVRDTPKLRDKYDVILFGPSGDALSVVAGLGGDKPIAWKKTDLTPNLGMNDEADDIRGGLELEGVLHLREFVKAGGLFITIGNSSTLPMQFGLAGGISVRQTTNLWARGGVFKAAIADKSSPIVYGYDDTLGIYFNQAPVFGLGGGMAFGGGMGGMRGAAATGRPSGRGTAKDPDIPQGRPRDIGVRSVEEFRKAQPAGEAAPAGGGQRGGTAGAGPRPRTIMSFARNVGELLISGGLAGGEELAGAPALVSVQHGAGHILMFSFNPMWRHQTHGSYGLVLNAMLNFQNLAPPAAAPAPPAKE